MLLYNVIFFFFCIFSTFYVQVSTTIGGIDQNKLTFNSAFRNLRNTIIIIFWKFLYKFKCICNIFRPSRTLTILLYYKGTIIIFSLCHTCVTSAASDVHFLIFSLWFFFYFSTLDMFDIAMPIRYDISNEISDM